MNEIDHQLSEPDPIFGDEIPKWLQEKPSGQNSQNPQSTPKWSAGESFGSIGGFVSADINDCGFPVDAMPPVAARMTREIARVTTSRNVPLAASSVLGFLSASIGAGIEIQTGGGRTTRGNLYLLAIAESGTGKGENKWFFVTVEIGIEVVDEYIVDLSRLNI